MSTSPGDLLLDIDADTKGVESGIARTTASMDRLQDKIVKTALAAAQLDRQIDDELNAALRENARAADMAARAAEDSARKQAAAYDKTANVLLGVGAAGVVALGLTGKAAIDWQSDWAGVEKTVDGTATQMEQLEEDIRGLTDVLPATHEEIAGVAAAAGALGVKRQDVTAFTKTMIDLGEATDDLDAMTAATELAQFMNIMRTGQQDVGRLGAAVVALGNDGASTEGDIVSMAMRIASAGKTARLSEADVLGLSSALTSMGIEAEAGGTAASKVLLTINDAVIDGGKNLQTFADLAGLSAEQFAARWREDPVEALTLVLQGMNGVTEAGGSMTATLEGLGLSDQRVSNALRSMAGNVELVQHAVEVGNTGWEEQTALLEEVAKRYATTESQLKIARNQLVDAGIDIGNYLLPAISGVAQGAAGMAEAFTGLPGPVKGSLTAVAGFITVSALGAGAAIKLHGALNKMLDQFEAAPGLVTATSRAMRGLSIAGVVVGGLVGISEAIGAIQDAMGARSDVSKFTGELVLLGGKGEVTGELLRSFGDDLGGISHDLNMVTDDWLEWVNSKGWGRDEVERIHGIDEALAQLVQGGNSDLAKAAFDRMSEAAQRGGDSAEEFAAKMPSYAEAVKVAAFEQDRMSAGADGLVGTLDDLPPAMDDAGQAAEELSPLAEELADMFGLTDQEASDAADALDHFDDVLSGIADKWLGEERAVNDLQQAWNELASEIADATESGEGWSFALDGTSDAALRNQDIMSDFVDSYLDVIGTWDRTKLTSDELKDKIADQKQAFIDQMVQLGYSRDAVEKYAGIFDQIPTDLPLDIPITVHDQQIKDAKTEARFLKGALKALEEPTPITVDDEPARSTASVWLNDAAHEYFVPHTVDVDVDDSVARSVGSVWLNDAVHNYFVPHTVHASADDSSARATGLDWKYWADEIFGDRTVHVDVDVDIPWGDLEWLEDHLPQGPGGRIVDQDGGGSGGRVGQQSFGDGGRGTFGVQGALELAGYGARSLGGGSGSTADLAGVVAAGIRAGMAGAQLGPRGPVIGHLTLNHDPVETTARTVKDVSDRAVSIAGLQG